MTAGTLGVEVTADEIDAYTLYKVTVEATRDDVHFTYPMEPSQIWPTGKLQLNHSYYISQNYWHKVVISSLITGRIWRNTLCLQYRRLDNLQRGYGDIGLTDARSCERQWRFWWLRGLEEHWLSRLTKFVAICGHRQC